MHRDHDNPAPRALGGALLVAFALGCAAPGTSRVERASGAATTHERAATPSTTATPTSSAAPVPSPAGPRDTPLTSPPTPPGAPDGWASRHASVRAAVARGEPLVLQVVVPLCSNEQIACGTSALGSPGRLETNLYWGAIFGAKRFLARQASGWELVDAARTEEGAPSASPLEQAVFRRWVPGDRWGRSERVELLVVLEAVHGQAIDSAVDRFFYLATEGGRVAFRDRGLERRVAVSVAGYAGHNRLLDGKRLPPARERAGAMACFVLACLSERFFGAPLRAAGADTLLTTGAFMAPEGYIIDAVTTAIGANASAAQIRQAAIEAAVRWQDLPRADAARTFVSPASLPIDVGTSSPAPGSGP